jgi:hypothetical protein
VLVSGPVAGFLFVACRQVRLRERAASLPQPARGELLVALDALERAARAYRVPVADVRDAEAPADEALTGSWCTTASAATRLRLSERRVQQLAAGGVLPARRCGRSWVIDDEAVAILAAERRRTA